LIAVGDRTGAHLHENCWSVLTWCHGTGRGVSHSVLSPSLYAEEQPIVSIRCSLARKKMISAVHEEVCEVLVASLIPNPDRGEWILLILCPLILAVCSDSAPSWSSSMWFASAVRLQAYLACRPTLTRKPRLALSPLPCSPELWQAVRASCNPQTVYAALRRKQQELRHLQREIEALNIAILLLADDEDELSKAVKHRSG